MAASALGQVSDTYQVQRPGQHAPRGNNDGTLQITAPATGGTRLTWTARPRH